MDKTDSRDFSGNKIENENDTDNFWRKSLINYNTRVDMSLSFTEKKCL